MTLYYGSLLLALWAVCFAGAYGYQKAWEYYLWHEKNPSLYPSVRVALHKEYLKNPAGWTKIGWVCVFLAAPYAYWFYLFYDSQWRRGMRFRD